MVRLTKVVLCWRSPSRQKGNPTGGYIQAEETGYCSLNEYLAKGPTKNLVLVWHHRKVEKRNLSQNISQINNRLLENKLMKARQPYITAAEAAITTTMSVTLSEQFISISRRYKGMARYVGGFIMFFESICVKNKKIYPTASFSGSHIWKLKSESWMLLPIKK